MTYQFRVWHKNNEKMDYKFEIPTGSLWSQLNFLLSSEDYGFMKKLNLKDKNGKEMYEGDIVKTWDGTGQPCFGGQLTVLADKTYFTRPDCIEVVGNIYENNDLSYIKNA
jgi:hypothetical protein